MSSNLATTRAERNAAEAECERLREHIQRAEASRSVIQAERYRLAAMVDRVTELHRPCECLAACHECASCVGVQHPCPTIRALDGEVSA